MNFPNATRVNRTLPKELLTRKLKLDAPLKAALRDQVQRVSITHELSETSLHIIKGETVSAIFVVEFALKGDTLNERLIAAFAKNNKNPILFVIRGANTLRLAVVYGKMYTRDCIDDSRTAHDAMTIQGLTMDEVWENIVAYVAGLSGWSSAAHHCTLIEALNRQEQVQTLTREISRLEAKARKEQQPRKKMDLLAQMNERKKRLEGLS